MQAARAYRLLPCLVFLLVWHSAAFAETWTKNVYETDGFEVEFSGGIQTTPIEMNAETRANTVRSTSYMQNAGDSVYFVGATLVRSEVLFDAGSSASFAAYKCKVTILDSALAFGKGRARRIQGTNCGGGTYTAYTRYFTTGKWFYQIGALFKQDSGLDEAARHFVTSFNVIGRK